MKYFIKTLFAFCLLCTPEMFAQPMPSKILVLAELGDIHRPFVDTAKAWIDTFVKKENYSVTYIEDPTAINDHYLQQFQLIVQLNYPPYAWSDEAKQSFQKYIDEGKGGWIGFHHASLLGEFDGYALWDWFYHFMGDIRWKDYIATFASATVNVEAREHPCMKGIDLNFTIEKEEWYTYDRSPRENVKVLASVNESSYKPSSKIVMGDHPVVWTNLSKKARNIYIFMGHDPSLFRSSAYKMLFANSIRWASGN